MRRGGGVRRTYVAVGAALSWCYFTGAAEAPVGAADGFQVRLADAPESFASRLNEWPADPSFHDDEELSGLWQRISTLATAMPAPTDGLPSRSVEPVSPSVAAAGEVKRPVRRSSPVLSAKPVPKLAQAARPKVPSQKSARGYIERVVDQGDAGDLKVRYVHRKCGPAKMIDVCYMPAANRKSIVVQRW